MNFIYRYPEPEKWVWIPEWAVPNIYPYRYRISTYGRVYNTYTEHFLPQKVLQTKNIYNTISVNLKDGTSTFVQVHRIVLLTFNYNENHQELDVNHIDGVKFHNWLWNLEWATKKENVNHAIQHNLISLGEDRDNSLITNEQVEEICKLISEGKSPSQIAKLVKIDGVNVATISKNIKGGLSWKHISSKYDFSKSFSRFIFTEEEIHKICKYLEDHGKDTSTYEIMNDCLGVDYYSLNKKKRNKCVMAISYIRQRKTYKDICNKYNY